MVQNSRGPFEAVLIPEYMKKFECIGGKCKDSCCSAGWDIYVNRDMYKRYRKIRDPKVKAVLESKFQRLRGDYPEALYAKIKLKEDGNCPFLTEEKLCWIQLNLGEDYLSLVCRCYPRVFNQVNGQIERSVELSCPEAARLVLLNPKGIEFEQTLEQVGTCYVHLEPINTFVSNEKNPERKYFWELRIFSIQVLQNRNYSIADRLIILGMFFVDVQESITKGNIDDIQNLISSYQESIEKGELNEVLSEIPVLPDIQMEFLKLLIDTILRKKTEGYKHCLSQVLEGIGYKPDVPQEVVAEEYRKLNDKYFLPFISDHEYLLENYLVNYVFNNLFPCGRFSTVYQEYMMLVIHYALIKFNLIGMAGFSKEVNLDIALSTIQCFSRSFDHYKAGLESTVQLLEYLGYTKLSDMIILIKY